VLADRQLSRGRQRTAAEAAPSRAASKEARESV
jgi:hypothetical protein